jgi:hypothetical protein
MQHSWYAKILATQHTLISFPLLYTRYKSMALKKFFCLWNTELRNEMSQHIWQDWPTILFANHTHTHTYTQKEQRRQLTMPNINNYHLP